MRRYIAFIVILISSSAALAQTNSNAATFKMTGDVTLLSHYVENGLSQSDKSPALQGSFFFNFGPQFRLGLWGSNTNYKFGDDHFNLRAIADVSINISPTTNFVISYSRSQFYNGGEHNANLLDFTLNFWTEYRILYKSTNNWEATNKNSTRFAFGKVTNVFNGWRWDNEIGYSSPKLATINPYFDAKTGIGTKWGAIFFEGALTGTSESSQFDGTGDFFFILSAKTEL